MLRGARDADFEALVPWRCVRGTQGQSKATACALPVAMWTLTALGALLPGPTGIVEAAETVEAATRPDRTPVTSLRPLLLAALEHGSAHGTLAGEAASFLTQHFASTAPIEIDVRTLHRLPQSGCQRLEVTTAQRGVIDRGDGQPRDARVVYQLSYCREGEFPKARRP